MNGFWGFLVITIASPILLLCDLWFIHGFVCRLVFPLVLQQLLLSMLPKDLKMPESWLRCEHVNFIYMAFCHDSDNLPVTWVCRSFSPALGRDTSPAFYSVRYMTLFEEWGSDSEPCTTSSPFSRPDRLPWHDKHETVIDCNKQGLKFWNAPSTNTRPLKLHRILSSELQACSLVLGVPHV